MKFVMAGGGTGGHIIPALAVAESLRGSGHEPVFIGTRQGMEARLVPQAGFPIEWIEIGGLNRVGFRKRLRTLWQLPVSVLRVMRMLGHHKPGAIFSMGGYVAAPVVLAGLLRRIPVVMMEPNAIPGMTTRKLARFASRALINFSETGAYFPEGVVELTGVPVRRAFHQIVPKSSEERFTLLVTGGSQGSRTLNQAMAAALPLFAAAGVPIRILHQAGRNNSGPLRTAIAESGVEGEVLDFVEEMPEAFAEADLILCRSGASTVAELAAAGKPSILVPFPFAADNHQHHNAEAMRRRGAARLIPDQELTGQRLFDEVTQLMIDRAALESMAYAAHLLAKPHAAREAADVLLELVR